MSRTFFQFVKERTFSRRRFKRRQFVSRHKNKLINNNVEFLGDFDLGPQIITKLQEIVFQNFVIY